MEYLLLSTQLTAVRVLRAHTRLRHAVRRKPTRILSSYDETRIPKLHQTQLEEIPTVNVVKEQVKASLVPEEKGIKLPFPAYVKLKESDVRYAKILTTLKSQTPEYASDQVLLEGVRLINDAIEAGVELQTLLFSREETLCKVKFRSPETVKLYKVLYKTLQIWSSLDTCPGIMGIFKKPEIGDLMVLSDPVIPVTVLGYNIRSHRIMGSVIRNAASAGCRCVMFTKGCMNAWNQKVIRASCGAHFRIPVVDNVEWPNVFNYLPDDPSVYLINSQRNECEVSFDDLAELSEQDVHDDSDDEVQEDSESDNSKSKKYVCEHEGRHILIDEEYKDKDALSVYEPEVLRTAYYTDVMFPSKNIVICVSEQNFCEDPRAIKLGSDCGGLWLNVPAENKINSIGSALALPVILYEIKRQLGEEYVTK